MCVITVKRFVKRINRKIDVRWMAIFDGYKERSIIKLFKYSMLGVKKYYDRLSKRIYLDIQVSFVLIVCI